MDEPGHAIFFRMHTPRLDPSTDMLAAGSHTEAVLPLRDALGLLHSQGLGLEAKKVVEIRSEIVSCIVLLLCCPRGIARQPSLKETVALASSARGVRRRDGAQATSASHPVNQPSFKEQSLTSIEEPQMDLATIESSLRYL